MSEIKISLLEKIVVNSCSPFLYIIDKIYYPEEQYSLRDIFEAKVWGYQRLLDVHKNHGYLPDDIKELYSASICGVIMLKTFDLRNRLKPFSD